MVLGTWYSFAIVLDGTKLNGVIHIDSSYGYNSGSDQKVNYHLVLDSFYIYELNWIYMSPE